MRLGQLLVYFNTSPALRLLRSPNAPFIIDFLERNYKQAGRIAVPHSDLLTALVSYQEEVQELDPDALPTKAETYLSEWCASDSRWLQRLLETGRDEPIYQLTPHTEDVFIFLDRALNKDLGFVGTESRLKLVIDTLSDLAIGSSDNPEIRLQHLQAEKFRIQAEIEQIEADGRVSKYQPAQIRERFATAVTLLRQLQGDFRAVEESFRHITSQVQQRQVAGAESRGGILEFALDAEDLLKRDDQGVSFYEFVRLILSPSQTEQLEEVISNVRRISELEQQHEDLETIRGMVTLLQREAEKVMRTNQRLSATLRRLLDFRTHAERQRIAHLLQEVQACAAKLRLEPGSNNVGLTLELEPSIESPFRRSFWSESPRFESVDLTQFLPDADERRSAFDRLAAMRNLNWKEMRFRIRQMLAVEHAPSLGCLLEVHPVEGVVEVIAYLQIAVEDGHLIDTSAAETVMISSENPDEPPVAVTIPRVTFVPERRNGHAK
jgi:hypothetical protein